MGSLTAQLLFYDGFTPATGVAIVLAAIVVRDAVGFRRLLGVHSEAINHIMEGLHPSKKKHFPHLTESIGHSPAEAIVGGLAGLAISIFATIFLYLLQAIGFDFFPIIADFIPAIDVQG